jgi:3-deoxy-D-manno-octulosonate 8-phosphate phosphatase (KDO 8-P phosphatase)
MDGDMNDVIKRKAAPIKLVLTDVDGVWTDTGVYYAENGELLKRFSIRDGMGVERLLHIAKVETGIVSGENSGAVIKRAEKLGITELHLGIRDKTVALREIMMRRGLVPEQIAFIGDDTNDLAVMQAAGLSACPADAVAPVKIAADFVCENRGGHGAFRDFAEFIISSKLPIQEVS